MQEKISLEALSVQTNIREIVYRRARSFHGNIRRKFGDYRGDRGDHDRPDSTRLTGAIVWKGDWPTKDFYFNNIAKQDK